LGEKSRKNRKFGADYIRTITRFENFVYMLTDCTLAENNYEFDLLCGVFLMTSFIFPAYHDIAQEQEQTARSIQLLSSSKLNLRGLITKLKVSDMVSQNNSLPS
jgi:hypothetical protein